MIAMEFVSIKNPPSGYTPCLIRRDLSMRLSYGFKERRSEFLISFYTGYRWLSREENWISYSIIPPENSKGWCPSQILPEYKRRPALGIIPQPVTIGSLYLLPGLHFVLLDDKPEKTWRVYIRHHSVRGKSDPSAQWLAIGTKSVSSWLKLPLMDCRLRTDAVAD